MFTFLFIIHLVVYLFLFIHFILFVHLDLLVVDFACFDYYHLFVLLVIALVASITCLLI